MSQPGKLRELLAVAGKHGVVRVIYQPKSGNLVEHWEHVGWLCIKAQNIIILGDEIDAVCSASSPKNADSPYWKKHQKMPALDYIVNYGRHSHIAFLGVSRAPQDVWRRLRGQAHEMLVFKMDDSLEVEALRSRLGSNADALPNLGQFEYLDWIDGGEVKICTGKD